MIWGAKYVLELCCSQKEMQLFLPQLSFNNNGGCRQEKRALGSHSPPGEAASVPTFAPSPKPPSALLDLGFSPAESVLAALILLSSSASCSFSSCAAVPAGSPGATTPGAKLP